LGQEAGRITAWLYKEWPRNVTDPLIRLLGPALQNAGNKSLWPLRQPESFLRSHYFRSWGILRCDWRKVGLWNLVFMAGVLIGGILRGN